MENNIDYKDYIENSSLELSEEQLDEKWGVGVLVVNKKIDKMGEELKQALVDANLPAIQAQNIDDVEEYKNASKEKKEAAAKKLEKLAEAKKKATKSIEDKMYALCREKGLGKGAGDPRCSSHCRYIISKAQKEAIDEILKQTEAFIDDKTKEALGKLSKKREEIEKETKSYEGKPKDEIPVTAEELEDEFEENPEAKKELYDEVKGADGEKEYKRKYASIEDYKKDHKDLEDKVLIEVTGDTEKLKGKWPEDLEEDIDSLPDLAGDKAHLWYDGYLLEAPCPSLEDMQKDDKAKEFFNSLVPGSGKKSPLDGKEITKENFGEKVAEAINGIEDKEEKKSVLNVIKYSLFAQAISDSDSDLYKASFDDEKVIEKAKELFSADNIGNVSDDIKQIIGAENISKYLNNFGEKQKVLVSDKSKEVINSVKQKTETIIQTMQESLQDADGKNAKKIRNTLANNFIGLVNTLNRTWRTVGSGKSYATFPSEELNSLYDAIFGKKENDKYVTPEGKTFSDFVNATMQEKKNESRHFGVLKFEEWLLNEAEKINIYTKRFDVEKAVDFFNDDSFYAPSYKNISKRVEKISDAVEKINGTITSLFQGEEQSIEQGIFPSKNQQSRLKDINKQGEQEIDVKMHASDSGSHVKKVSSELIDAINSAIEGNEKIGDKEAFLDYFKRKVKDREGDDKNASPYDLIVASLKHNKIEDDDIKKIIDKIEEKYGKEIEGHKKEEPKGEELSKDAKNAEKDIAKEIVKQ